MLSGSKPTPPLEIPPLPVPIAPTSLPSARSPCAFAQGDRPMSLAHFRSKLRDFFHSSYDRRFYSMLQGKPAVIDRRYSQGIPIFLYNPRMQVLRVAGTLVIMLLLVACSRSQESTAMADAQPGIPLTLATERARTIQGLHYDLSFAMPAAATEPIPGRAAIHFDLKEIST